MKFLLNTQEERCRMEVYNEYLRKIPQLLEQLEAVEKMYEKARALKGKVSGEHGIGYAKKAYMAEELGETQIALMRGIKQVFDPTYILNPDKLF